MIEGRGPQQRPQKCGVFPDADDEPEAMASKCGRLWEDQAVDHCAEDRSSFYEAARPTLLASRHMMRFFQVRISSNGLKLWLLPKEILVHHDRRQIIILRGAAARIAAHDDGSVSRSNGRRVVVREGTNWKHFPNSISSTMFPSMLLSKRL